MKRIGVLLAALALLFTSAAAESENLYDLDDRLRSRWSAECDELWLNDLPAGELTRDILSELEDAQANRLFEEVLPWAVEHKYVQELPRSAYLHDEGKLWVPASADFLELYDMLATTAPEDMPRYYAHGRPDCDLSQEMDTCTYFSVYFWSLETIIDPCPKCFPEGWIYRFSVSPQAGNMNRLAIFFHDSEGVTRRAGEPSGSVTALFDRKTDKLLTISVPYDKQGYVLMWRSEEIEISGVVARCPCCDGEGAYRADWQGLEAGLWHCRNCASLYQAEKNE